MTDILAHRGPDDSGCWVKADNGKASALDDGNGNIGFGHRRLSIIDLSSLGRQPMSNADESIWIVYNGEVYNYVELREELEKLGYTFRSRTDTEVIIYAYEHWGEECVNRFNGMFAFALWDARQRILFCARDRLGIKPFYYYYDGTVFLFASEIKSILLHPSYQRKPNYRAILGYIKRLYPVNDETWFAGIERLEAGYTLTVRKTGLKLGEYWNIPDHEDIDCNVREEPLVDELRELLRDAIQIRLRSDVPIGAYLSGGLDSSLLVAYSRGVLNYEINTYSGYFEEAPEYDERRFIDIISKRFSTNHHYILSGPEDFRDIQQTLLWHFDEPVAGDTVCAQYYVNRKAREKVKVILSGLGGDELCGGYYRYLLPWIQVFLTATLKGTVKVPEVLNTLAMAVNHAKIVGLRNFLTKRSRYKHLPKVLNPDFVKCAGEAGENDSGNMGEGENPLRRALAFDLKYYMQGLLMAEDRISMSVSQESRVPFIDYRLVEFMFRIPDYLKMKELNMKYLLRKAGEKILPREITWRGDKRGYYVPTRLWYRNKLYENTRALLEESNRGIIAPQDALQFLQNHKTGRENNEMPLWILTNIELWFRTFMDGESIENVGCDGYDH